MPACPAGNADSATALCHGHGFTSDQIRIRSISMDQSFKSNHIAYRAPPMAFQGLWLPDDSALWFQRLLMERTAFER